MKILPIGWPNGPHVDFSFDLIGATILLDYPHDKPLASQPIDDASVRMPPLKPIILCHPEKGTELGGVYWIRTSQKVLHFRRFHSDTSLLNSVPQIMNAGPEELRLRQMGFDLMMS